MRRRRAAAGSVSSSLALLAMASLAVLLVTVAVGFVIPDSEGWRRAWVVMTFASAGVLAALLVQEINYRRNSDRALERATDALREVSVAPTDDLAGLPIGEVLDRLTGRLRDVVRADWSMVALSDDRSGELRVMTVDGQTPYTTGDVIDEEVLPSDGTAERLAVPLMLAGDRLGLIEVGAAAGTTFTRSEHDLLRILADNLAATIERAYLADAERRSRLGVAQARAHLSLIAEASVALARVFEDTKPALIETAELLVRDFVDSCAIHLTRPDGKLELIAFENKVPRPASTSARELMAQFPGALDGVHRVMASGKSELSFVRPDGEMHGKEDDAAGAMRASGMVSWVTAPIRVRGLAIGAVTVATGPDRRGFRPSDQAVIDELARRIAIAIERSMLYRETRQAAEQAEERALQLADLYDDVRSREQRLAALLEASPLAIIELDLHGHVQDSNRAARDLYLPDDTLPPALAECLEELLPIVLTGHLADREVRVLSTRGHIDLMVYAAPLHGRTAPEGMLVMMSDTTERNRLEEQLIESHRYEAIAQLAGGIAHDFNNLLTIIVGYSDLLQRSLPSDSPERDEVVAIHEAGRHAAVITNQLLTLSRRQVLQPVVVPVDKACESLEPMLRRLAGDRVSISMSCATDAAIRIDPGQLEQVLFNLVLNSRDAMPSGGTVEVHVIEQQRAGGADEIAIEVTDTGEGMSEETIARCLEPFFTTKGRRGIGLGLATVSSVVQRSGGRLEIESELGKGTTITAVFPRAVDRAAVVAPSTHAVRARVLLVDDDELIRRYAKQVLADAGFDVVTAPDAEAALDEMTREQTTRGAFDLVVSDVVLPGMNGFELARRVHSRWPATARLLMTGYVGTDTEGTDLEGVAVLAKPFAGDDLVRAAGEALSSPATADTAQGSNR